MPPPKDPQRHPEYHIRGGDLFISCGQTMYKVHSYFFLRESSHWRSELVGSASASTDASPIKGVKESAPYVLDDQQDAFEQILWVFYNPKYGDYSKATPQNWDTILRYSHKWDFPHIKELAIRHIQNSDMPPIPRIKLYEETKVPPQYLFPLYTQIASREKMLSLDESRMLGFETLILIQHARERLRAEPLADKPLLSPVRKDLKETEVAAIISSVFGLTLKDPETRK